MRRYRIAVVFVLLGSVPLIAAVFAMRLIFPVGQSQAAEPVQQAAPVPVVEEKVEQVLVLAAAQFLPVGTLLAARHLTEIGIEEDSVRRGHIEAEDLEKDEMPYGYAVREAIEAGAPLTWFSLVGPRQRGFLATVLKPGMRAATVRLGADADRAGHTRPFAPGDRVDVVLTARSRERGGQSVLIRRFLENVRVLAVNPHSGSVAGAASPGDEASRKGIVTATLEVLPSQKGLLSLGELEGQLSLVVRSLAVAGATAEALDLVEMKGPPALPRDPAAQFVLFPPAQGALQRNEQPVAPDIGRQHALAAAGAGPGSVLMQRLAGGLGLSSAAGWTGAAEKSVELVASSFPESAPVENDPDAELALETLRALTPAQPARDGASEERVSHELAPPDAIGPMTTPESASSLGEGTLAQNQQPVAFGFEPQHAPAATHVDPADSDALHPARGVLLTGEATSAGPASGAMGFSAVSDRKDGLEENGLGAGLTLEALGALRATRRDVEAPAQEHVSRGASTDRVDESAVAGQAVQAAIASLPWDLLSRNGTVIAGGPILLFGLAGAFLWLRRQDRRLRMRLQSVGAPLTGRGAAERVAPEESIFRPTRPQSQLSWLWRRIERRHPLIDAPRAFPRLVGIGVLAAAAVWVGMWLLGMSGWWSMPAAALAGFAGAWFLLRRMQARMENQFIEQFPEIVDQIVRLSGAGLPPLEVLGKVAEDAQQPVKGVLEEVSDALLAGLDADTALGMVAERVRLAEFTLFAAVIRLQRRAGGSISGAFSNLADTLRERRTTALKARASTAQTRLTLLVLMLMPPLVLGVQSTTSPESVDLLFNSEDGQTLLQLGVGLIVVGLIVARQIGARGAK